MNLFKSAVFILAVTMTASVVVAALPENEVIGKILSFGLYETTGKRVELPAPNAAAGKALINAQYTHRETTDTIPMTLGNTFGFKFRLANIPTDVISRFKFVCRHPPKRGANGTRSEVSSYELNGVSPVSYLEDFFTYELSTPAELVAGSWTLEIWRNGKNCFQKRL